MPLTDTLDGHTHNLDFTLLDYAQLVDWAGRIIREGKRGFMPASCPPVMARLPINPIELIAAMQAERRSICLLIAIGRVWSIQQFVANTGRKFIRSYKEIQPICLG